jgi:hypothetical protein
MLKKYGSLDNIIRVLGKKENKELTQISLTFDSTISKLSELIKEFTTALIKEE